MMSSRKPTRLGRFFVLFALAGACTPAPSDPTGPIGGGMGTRSGGAGGSVPNTGGAMSGGGGAPSSTGGQAAGGSGGGQAGASGTGGAGGNETGGAGGNGMGPTGTGGAGEAGGAAGGNTGGATGGEDAAPTDTAGGPTPPSGPLDFGGVGQVIPVPVQVTATPTPPLVAPACPGDLTAGFTEYRDSFVVQRPRNLPASARMKYENGVYQFWVTSGDLSHKPDSSTEPRTEARYSDISTGEHIWSGDVMFESPSKTCVFQIHNVNSPIAIYLRVVGNRMFNLSTGTTIATDLTGKWFNLKVAFNIATREVRTYINGCLKETSRAPGTASVNKWYFKHGVYTCDSGTCRSSYKNIRTYHKGSTDTFNVKSTYP